MELNEINGLWESSSILQQQIESRWAINDRLANSKHITERKPGRSSLFVPKIQGYLRRKLSDDVQSFTGDDPVSLKPTFRATRKGSMIMQKLINNYLDQDIDWFSTVYNGSFNALHYNFAPAIVSWERGTSNEEVETLNEDGNTVIETIEITSYSKPVIDIIPPEDFRIDSAVGWNEADQARYVGRRVYRSFAYAQQKHANGEWPELDEKEFGSRTTNSVLTQERRSISPFSTQSIEDNDLVEIREHYFYEEVNGSLVPYRVETLEDRLILSESPLDIDFSGGSGQGGFPFVIGQIYAKAHEMYAPALPEIGEQMNIEVNAVRNQRRDNVALILSPEKLVGSSAGVEASALSFTFPGKVTPMTDINAVKWIVPPDVTSSGYNEESTAVNDMDRLFSEGPQRSGAAGQRKETATASQIMAAGASAAASLDLSVFSKTFVEPLVKKLIALASVAEEPETFVEIANFLEIQSDDPFSEAVSGRYKVKVIAGALQERLNNEISNASNVAGLIQTIYGPQANYFPIVAKVIEAYSLEAEEIIQPPQNQEMGVPQLQNIDQGGVEPGGTPSIQPRVQLQGGQFGSA